MGEIAIAGETPQALVEHFSSPDLVARRKAREALTSMAEQAADVLAEALRSPDQWVRWEAAKVLSSTPAPSALLALVEALEDEQPGVRWLAATALVRIGEASVVPVLHGLLGRADSPWFREGAHHVLKSLVTAETSDVVHGLEGRFQPISVPVLANNALAQLERRKRDAGGGNTR